MSPFELNGGATSGEDGGATSGEVPVANSATRITHVEESERVMEALGQGQEALETALPLE